MTLGNDKSGPIRLSVGAEGVAPELAPKGVLRVAVNLTGGVLARKSAETGAWEGIAVKIAREVGRIIDRPVDFSEFSSGREIIASAGRDVFDLTFLGVSKDRKTDLHFSPPYMCVEATYLVPSGCEFRTVRDIENSILRIAAARGSPYEAHLSKVIPDSRLVGCDSFGAALDLFLAGESGALAGVRQVLLGLVKLHPSVRLLPDNFLEIPHAMATPVQGAKTKAFLAEIAHQVKRTNFLGE